MHENRALFHTNVRVDVLVITRQPEGAGAPYGAETMRFPRIGDGDRLPFDNWLVYHGRAQDFVDLCIWVSRDRAEALDLSEMIAASAGAAEVQGALGSLLALTAVAPQAAAIVAAAGAAATPAKVGYRLLAKATGDSIGLYRTSLLSVERFGLGRHPPEGLMRSQGFSFGFEVLAPDESTPV